MLRNNKGFFLLELLLSLSALFMISLFFIPLLMDLKNQSRQLDAETKARQILFEELQEKMNGVSSFYNISVSENGVVYQVKWRDSRISGQKEGCVSVDPNSFVSITEICNPLE